jgi:hypothetical protein
MLRQKKFGRNGLSVAINIQVKTSSAGAAPPGGPSGNTNANQACKPRRAADVGADANIPATLLK